LDPQLHELVVIQYYAFDEEISLIKGLGFDVETIEDAFGDITSVAHAITCCDAVITIDNYLIHLAGALGVPTLGLLPLHASYRWALDAAVSPIYENVSLARQAAYNEWDLALEAIAPFLNKKSKS
jgi:ADP-heptose:LPS heptosyltransferase